MPSPASTATWCRKASSIRPRWCAPRCRTRPQWPACSSPPRRWSQKCRGSRRLPCRLAPAEWAGEWTSDRSAIQPRCEGPGAKSGPFFVAHSAGATARERCFSTALTSTAITAVANTKPSAMVAVVPSTRSKPPRPCRNAMAVLATPAAGAGRTPGAEPLTHDFRQRNRDDVENEAGAERDHDEQAEDARRQGGAERNIGYRAAACVLSFFVRDEPQIDDGGDDADHPRPQEGRAPPPAAAHPPRPPPPPPSPPMPS